MLRQLLRKVRKTFEAKRADFCRKPSENNQRMAERLLGQAPKPNGASPKNAREQVRRSLKKFRRRLERNVERSRSRFMSLLEQVQKYSAGCSEDFLEQLPQK